MRRFDDGVGCDKLAGGAAGNRARLGMGKAGGQIARRLRTEKTTRARLESKTAALSNATSMIYRVGQRTASVPDPESCPTPTIHACVFFPLGRPHLSKDRSQKPAPSHLFP